MPVGLPGTNHPVDSAEARRLRAEIAATRAQLAELKWEGKGRVAKGEGATLLGRLGGLVRSLKYELARLDRSPSTSSPRSRRASLVTLRAGTFRMVRAR